MDENYRLPEELTDADTDRPTDTRTSNTSVRLLWLAVRYGGAVLAVAIGALVRWLLQDICGPELPFITFFPAVGLVAITAGSGPAALAIVLSAEVIWNSIGYGTRNAGEVVGMILFIGSGLIFSMMAEMIRREQRRRAVALLERVAERVCNQALRDREERLRRFIENAPVALAMFDREMRYLAVSHRWKMHHHLETENLVGRSYNDDAFLPVPEHRTAVHRRALKGEVAPAAEYRVVRADGTVAWERWELRPWFTAGGAIGGTIVFAEDISQRKRAEAALRDREARLQAILDTAVDAIITIDTRGIIQSVNPSAERIFGYAADEMIGQNVKMLMPAPFRTRYDDYLARYLRTGERRNIGVGRELAGRRKDGTIFPADIAISEIPHLGLFTGVVRDITRRKELEREVVEIASLEQRRIAQDLHDSVAQELTALAMVTKDLSETIETDPAGTARLVERIESGLQRSQKELRAVLRGLLPVAVEGGGLAAALDELAQRVQRAGNTTCTFECPDSAIVIDDNAATHLYLIAQEAVQNALKHAQAGNVRIALCMQEGLALSVQDDGISEWEPTSENPGLGLRVMENRAAIIGATLSIEAVEPRGTKVTCTMPVRNDESEETRKTLACVDCR